MTSFFTSFCAKRFKVICLDRSRTEHFLLENIVILEGHLDNMGNLDLWLLSVKRIVVVRSMRLWMLSQISRFIEDLALER